jgi:hypothetical protein
MNSSLDSLKYENQREYQDINEKFQKIHKESESLLRNPLGGHPSTAGGASNQSTPDYLSELL